MRVGAIIAEYNPFHNGHAYHIRDLRQGAKADYVVAIMSASFVQRGEPAILDKWARTNAALNNGVDLVLELPVYYSLANAQQFARGAINTLLSTGIVDTIGFGSEIDDLFVLERAAGIDLFNDKSLSDCIKKELARGISYPHALALSVKELHGDDMATALTAPNSLLGIEYIRAAKAHGYNDFYVTKRVGVMHDDDSAHENLASASAIRKMLISGNCARTYVPENIPLSFAGYDEARLSGLVLYSLRTHGKGMLAQIADVSEGLENVLFDNACACCEYSELLSRVKSKRYTMARIKRICMCSLLRLTTQCSIEPQYIRVLGVREEARAKLLSSLIANAKLPVIISEKDFDKLGDFARELLSYECFATDIHALISNKAMRTDYTEKLIII